MDYTKLAKVLEWDKRHLNTRVHDEVHGIPRRYAFFTYRVPVCAMPVAEPVPGPVIPESVVLPVPAMA